MPNIIKPKRGLEANRTSQTPAAGELTVTTDQRRIFIGDGTTAGGQEVGYERTQTAASQAEMEAGTEAALRSMSPLRVKQAITALVPAGLRLGTPVASTSGASIDFTSIPAGTKRITVSFNAVSTNGTDNWLVQLGDAGGVEATGYSGVGMSIAGGGNGGSSYTAGFGFRIGNASAVASGSLVMTLIDAATNTWAAVGNLAETNESRNYTTAGSKALSAALDRVRITTSGGTNTFDAGSINIAYE